MDFEAIKTHFRGLLGREPQPKRNEADPSDEARAERDKVEMLLDRIGDALKEPHAALPPSRYAQNETLFEDFPVPGSSTQPGTSGSAEVTPEVENETDEAIAMLASLPGETPAVRAARRIRMVADACQRRLGPGEGSKAIEELASMADGLGRLEQELESLAVQAPWLVVHTPGLTADDAIILASDLAKIPLDARPKKLPASVVIDGVKVDLSWTEDPLPFAFAAWITEDPLRRQSAAWRWSFGKMRPVYRAVQSIATGVSESFEPVRTPRDVSDVTRSDVAPILMRAARLCLDRDIPHLNRLDGLNPRLPKAVGDVPQLRFANARLRAASAADGTIRMSSQSVPVPNGRTAVARCNYDVASGTIGMVTIRPDEATDAALVRQIETDLRSAAENWAKENDGLLAPFGIGVMVREAWAQNAPLRTRWSLIQKRAKALCGMVDSLETLQGAGVSRVRPQEKDGAGQRSPT